MSLDKDCCLETYSEAYRLGKKDELARIVDVLERTLDITKGSNTLVEEVLPHTIEVVKGGKSE